MLLTGSCLICPEPEVALDALNGPVLVIAALVLVSDFALVLANLKGLPKGGH